MFENFTLAVVGCGRWGQNHVRTANRIFGKNLKYICDASESNLRKVMELAPTAQAIRSLEPILGDREVTAVIIATPAETHYAIAKKCLEAGKHVLIEKPLALDTAHAREIASIAERTGKTVMVGHVLLFHPAIRKAKELIEQGRIGKIQYVYSNRLSLGTVRKEENVWWSFAPHDVAVLQYLIGSHPTHVSAGGGAFLQSKIEDTVLARLTFAGNIHGHIFASWLHPFKEHRLVVVGDKAMLVFEDSRPDNKLMIYPKGFDWVNGDPQKRDGEAQVIDYPTGEALQKEQEYFAECVTQGKRPIADAVHGLSVLEVLTQAQTQIANQQGILGTSEAKALPKSEPKKELGYRVHETAIVDDGCRIGEGTAIWHFSHVQKGVVIGKNCSFGQNVNIGNNVRIGDNVKVQNNVSIYEGVELEDFVFCGPSMVFTNILTPRCEFPQRGGEFYLKTKIGRGTSIGANATIVCGHDVGKYALIGAGAVVTKDVPDYALIVGNPGRISGWMCRCGSRLTFNDNKSDCIKCKRHYLLQNNRVTCLSD